MTRSVLLGLCLLVGLSASVAQAAGQADSTSLDEIDWSKAPEYRIVPGDQLTFDFGTNPVNGVEISRDVVVRPDGRVTLFPVGDIVAAGRTPVEVQADALRLLSAELKQPRVTVAVTRLAGNQVHVLGRVKHPGSIPVESFTTLLQAIAGAGGFEDDAARNSVLIMHRVGLGTVRVARIKVDRLLKGAGDVPLARYDIVYVPRSTIGNIDVFAQQFFMQTQGILTSSILGWELFHLNRTLLLPTANTGSTSNQ